MHCGTITASHRRSLAALHRGAVAVAPPSQRRTVGGPLRALHRGPAGERGADPRRDPLARAVARGARGGVAPLLRRAQRARHVRDARAAPRDDEERTADAQRDLVPPGPYRTGSAVVRWVGVGPTGSRRRSAGSASVRRVRTGSRWSPVMSLGRHRSNGSVLGPGGGPLDRIGPTGPYQIPVVPYALTESISVHQVCTSNMSNLIIMYINNIIIYIDRIVLTRASGPLVLQLIHALL